MKIYNCNKSTFHLVVTCISLVPDAVSPPRIFGNKSKRKRYTNQNHKQ